MGKKSNIKGKTFERDLAKQFRELGWTRALRHLEYQAQEADGGVDLINVEPFGVQAKARKEYAPITAIWEVKDKKGVVPLLITKGNRQEPMAVMKWKDLKHLLKSLKNNSLI